MESFLKDIINLLSYNSHNPLLFSSGFFLWWFVIIFFGYILLQNKQTIKLVYLTIISYYFFYKSGGIFFFILFISTFVDFFVGKLLNITEKKSLRRLYLFLTLLVNLGLLSYFKYTNFFINTINSVGGYSIKNLNIFLPIGISFYTFYIFSHYI